MRDGIEHKVESSRPESQLETSVAFRYAGIYEEEWLRRIEKRPELKEQGYASEQETKEFMSEAEPYWRKFENNILSELSEIAKLQFKPGKVEFAVYGRCTPRSEPPMIRMYGDEPGYAGKDRFVDTLTHEMVHVLFSQNHERLGDAWDYIRNQYKGENDVTQTHIIVHAIHKHVLRKRFDENRLAETMKHPRDPRYQRAWEIVRNDGYQKIIQEFTSKLR